MKREEVLLPADPTLFLNKLKARLGSISKRKRAEVHNVSEAAFMILEADLPVLIALYEQARKPQPWGPGS